jgi:hypothetical protein
LQRHVNFGQGKSRGAEKEEKGYRLRFGSRKTLLHKLSTGSDAAQETSQVPV